MAQWEAMIRKIQSMSLNNDLKAAQILELLRVKFPSGLPTGVPVVWIISDLDAKF